MRKLTTITAAAALAVALTASANAHNCASHSNKEAKAESQNATAVSKTYQADIVETAIAAGQFTTLVTAVKEAGLVEALKGDGPFTVFAPTDDAFAALPEGTLEKLLADKDMLIAVLTYHVVPGNVKASDVMKLSEAETLQGQSVTVTTHDTNVVIDGAKVVQADIMTSNGVIHVIDRVILPEMEKN